ncbi:MAG: hypothetical protein AMXMBFR13_10430 [Phycisphaerae bacterium]
MDRADEFRNAKLRPGPKGPRARLRLTAMEDKLNVYEDAYHEGTEQTGIISLISIILGVLGIGLLMFSLTWALAGY